MKYVLPCHKICLLNFFLLQDSTKDYVCELCQKNGKQCCQTSPRQGCKTESELIDSSDFGIPMIINQSATSTIPRSNGKVCISLLLYSPSYILSTASLSMLIRALHVDTCILSKDSVTYSILFKPVYLFERTCTCVVPFISVFKSAISTCIS